MKSSKSFFYGTKGFIRSSRATPPFILDADTSYISETVSWATYLPTGGPTGKWAYSFDNVDDYIDLNDVVLKTFYIWGQDNTPAWIFVSPNWVHAYVCGTVNDSIYQYKLSVPWDISTATYVRTLVSVWNVSCISFNPAGTKLYASDDGSTITQYTLSTAWDISTAVSSWTFSTAAQSTAIRGIFVRDDGLKFYITENSAVDTVYQYSMTWGDITTGSYDSKSFSTNAQDTSNQSISFKDDGTRMFMLGDTSNNVYLYTLWTPWDVSTASYGGISFYVGIQESTPYWMCFWNNGNILYTVGGTTDTIYQYNLFWPYSFSNPEYSNGFTIIARIRPDSDGEASLWTIISKTLGGIAESWFYYSVNANMMRLRIWQRDGTGTNVSSAPWSIVYWNWVDVAVTVSSTWLVTHYINWVVSWTPLTGQPPSVITANVRSRIWNLSWATSRTFHGRMASKLFRIPYVLSADEINYIRNNY